MTLDRRQFLSTAAAGAAFALIGFRAESDHAADVTGLPHTELLAALGTDTVREIGCAYRDQVPAESTADSLDAALWGERRVARPCIEDRVRADFVEGRLVVVRGWILSVTEARQCALFSLLG